MIGGLPITSCHLQVLTGDPLDRDDTPGSVLVEEVDHPEHQQRGDNRGAGAKGHGCYLR